MSTIPGRPIATPEDAERLARDLFGRDGTATELSSDRDRNFRIHGDRSWVLKIANSGESDDARRTQHGAMRVLAQALGENDLEGGFATPATVPSKQGKDDESVELRSGRHAVRMATWVDGVPWARARPHTLGLVHQAGTRLGQVDAALAGLSLPEDGAPFEWDLLCAEDVLEAGIGQLEGGRRDLVAEILARYRARREQLASLPRQWIHNDANDHNWMVGAGNPEGGRGLALNVTGLIDLGDMRHTLRVADPAIALAYLVLDCPAPLPTVESFFAGYCGKVALTAEELDACWDLALARLGVSVCMSARQRALEPDNPYLSVTEGPAWNALPALLALHPHLPRAAARSGAGHAPCPRHDRVVAALAAVEPAAVLPSHDVAAFTHLDPVLESMGADAHPTERFGRYGEARQVYQSAGFADNGEPRTVHLGVDLFVAEGTAIHAPLAGTVEAVADNSRDLDYGPTVILRHEPHHRGRQQGDADGATFWTLYGHLARPVLGSLVPGDEVAAGQALAEIGGPHENGGWAPHLHFQVMTDLLSFQGDYPGVAAPGEEKLWRSFLPDPSPLLGIDAADPAATVEDAALLARRRDHLPPNLSVSYRKPLHIVRGVGAHLIDRRGRRFVDLVNNVCHVGHAHPDVVRVGATQMARLNTNTRYLHDNILACAERLLARFPAPLEVVFFTNSGSEANDLALRLARTHTARHGIVSLDGAYHGHLQSLVDISPYKHAGPGGKGPGAHVQVAPMPDLYRGVHQGEGAAERYAEGVDQALQALDDRGMPAGVFIHEGVLSCGGQIPLPAGYLQATYGHARRHGALCIDDEVQVGFGRVGESFWSFETHGVVPDLVTLGKPMGNGHPIAAVVTTRTIADSFANGMEYFNTFGGNPVSCAIAHEVLAVVEREGLQERARELGTVLADGLRHIMQRHPLIGDVRGPGLFCGFELVRSRDTKEPAAAEAAYLANRMRDEGYLISTDGPQHNVIKLKPPLVIERSDLDGMLRTLERVLGETVFTR